MNLHAVPRQERRSPVFSFGTLGPRAISLIQAGLSGVGVPRLRPQTYYNQRVTHTPGEAHVETTLPTDMTGTEHGRGSESTASFCPL